MLWGLLWYFCGYVRITIPSECYESAVIGLYQSGAKSLREKRCGDSCSFDFRISESKKAEEAFAARGIEVLGVRERGLLNLLRRYKFRPGLGVGMLIVLLSVFVSSRFLWSVEFDGLDKVSEDRAMEILEQHGIYVGCYIPSLELKELYNEILIDCDEFSWVSVNIRGTHANVEVRETERPNRTTPQAGKCANMISQYTAEITAVRVYSGEKAVNVGDAVKAGELLISGLYEDKMGRLVHKYAQGEVWGRFIHESEVRVPLEYEKKVYVGEITGDIELKIFSKSINISKYGRNIDSNYDIINNNEQLRLFDKVSLPVAISRDVYLCYTTEVALRDESTAENIAYAAAGRELLSIVGDGEILWVEYNGYVDGTEYVLKVEACLNTNIASVQEFVYNEG